MGQGAATCQDSSCGPCCVRLAPQQPTPRTEGPQLDDQVLPWEKAGEAEGESKTPRSSLRFPEKRGSVISSVTFAASLGSSDSSVGGDQAATRGAAPPGGEELSDQQLTRPPEVEARLTAGPDELHTCSMTPLVGSMHAAGDGFSEGSFGSRFEDGVLVTAEERRARELANSLDADEDEESVDDQASPRRRRLCGCLQGRGLDRQKLREQLRKTPLPGKLRKLRLSAEDKKLLPRKTLSLDEVLRRKEDSEHEHGHPV